MSTRSAWSALRLMRRTELRRSMRLPSTYLGLAVSFAAVVAFQHFAGVGDVDAGERPDGRVAGEGLVVGLAVSVASAGLLGPELRIPPAQAQWLLTAPGGAAGAVAARLGGTARASATLVAQVLMAQLITAGRIDLGYALYLGMWRAGLGPATASANFAFASYVDEGARRRLRRAAGCVVVAALCVAITRVESLTRFLGAPATGTGTDALLSITLWVGVSMGMALLAFRRAEPLVVRAVEASGPGGQGAARRSRNAKRQLPEPDEFFLSGPRALVWLPLMTYRRYPKAHLAVQGGLLVVMLLMVRYAPSWVPLVAGSLLLLLVTVIFSNDERGRPMGSQGSLLPFSFATSAAWRLPVGVLSLFELLGIPTLTWAVAGPGDPALRAWLPALLFAVAVFLRCVGGRVHDPARGTGKEHARRRGALAASVLGGGAGLYLLAPGSAGAGLACGLLLLAGAATLTYDVTVARRLSGPARVQRERLTSAGVIGTGR